MSAKVKCRIKVGDNVKFIAGDDKGKIGRVLRIIRKSVENVRLIVDGIMAKKSVKRDVDPTGFKMIAKSVHVSNVVPIKEEKENA